MADRVEEIDGDLKSGGSATVLNTKEVSKLLRIDRRTLYLYTKDGRIKGSRIGRDNRYTRREVARFLAASEY